MSLRRKEQGHARGQDRRAHGGWPCGGGCEGGGCEGGGEDGGDGGGGGGGAGTAQQALSGSAGWRGTLQIFKLL